MKRQTHTIRVSNGQHLAVAQQQAEKTGRSWFVLGAKGGCSGFYSNVVDETGRRGLEQYMALEYRPDGSCEVHEPAPRA